MLQILSLVHEDVLVGLKHMGINQIRLMNSPGVVKEQHRQRNDRMNHLIHGALVNRKSVLYF